MTDLSPSQLSTRDLLAAIGLRRKDLENEYRSIARQLRTAQEERAKLLSTLDVPQANDADPLEVARTLDTLERDIRKLSAQRPVNFYHQYYRAELHKKFALSAACFFLVFVRFFRYPSFG
jgi:lipopolysaccharide export system permease protein